MKRATNNSRIVMWGGGLFAPAVTVWFRTLETIKMRNPIVQTATRVGLDQFVFAPCVLSGTFHLSWGSDFAGLSSKARGGWKLGINGWCWRSNGCGGIGQERHAKRVTTAGVRGQYAGRRRIIGNGTWRRFDLRRNTHTLLCFWGLDKVPGMVADCIAFFTVMTLLEGKSMTDVETKWKSDFVPTLQTNWMV